MSSVAPLRVVLGPDMHHPIAIVVIRFRRLVPIVVAVGRPDRDVAAVLPQHVGILAIPLQACPVGFQKPMDGDEARLFAIVQREARWDPGERITRRVEAPDARAEAPVRVADQPPIEPGRVAEIGLRQGADEPAEPEGARLQVDQPSSRCEVPLCCTRFGVLTASFTSAPP